MKNQKGFTLIELIVTIAAGLSVVVGGVLVWVLFHFIAKFW